MLGLLLPVAACGQEDVDSELAPLPPPPAPLQLSGPQQLELNGFPVVLEFAAPAAGLLTVAARDDSDIDLVVQVTDADGQAIPQGRADIDLGGDRGAEQLVVALPWAGDYQVSIRELNSGTGSFEVGAGFFAMPSVGALEPEHARPSNAVPLVVGDEQEAGLSAERGVPWMWYRFDSTMPGIVTFDVQADFGDLVVEGYDEGSFADPTETSDQDIGGVLGNEMLSLAVGPGTPVYFRVRDRAPGDHVRFTAQASFQPN